MVEGLVATFANAALVSDVPDEALTTDTRAPTYMFLAAEWNRSSGTERAYLLAVLFGRQFDVEANDLSLQIATIAMTIGEPDGSAALIAADASAPSDDDTWSWRRTDVSKPSSEKPCCSGIPDAMPLIIDEVAAIDSEFFGSHAGLAAPTAAAGFWSCAKSSRGGSRR